MIWFILGKASIFIAVVVFLGVLSTPDTFDCYFVGTELLYFNVLFWNFASVFKLFRVQNYLKYQIQYFKYGFVKIIKRHCAFPAFEQEELN